jgi:hypothetical protein
MPDDPGAELRALLEATLGRHQPDVEWVFSRARAIRIRRALFMGLSVLLIIGIVSTVIVARPWDRTSTNGAILPADNDTSDVEPGEPLIEEMSEQEQAEVFAFRAMAAKELMGPFKKRSYIWTEEEDTTAVVGGWRVGFAAFACEPRNGTYRCHGLSGEDELGNALPDTFVTAAFEDGMWDVREVEGNMLPEERVRLIGYSLPQLSEPSHWEFPATGVSGVGPGLFMEMMALWVGPYPTSAPGSVCQAQPVDEEGQPVGEANVFFSEAPHRGYERGGWLRGYEQERSTAVDLTVQCRQYTGEDWEVASGPELVGKPGAVIAVAAQLEWHGDKEFTSAAECTASLVDEAGNEIWEGVGKVLPLHLPAAGEYPYEGNLYINIREPVDGHAIGEFECRSV